MLAVVHCFEFSTLLTDLALILLVPGIGDRLPRTRAWEADRRPLQLVQHHNRLLNEENVPRAGRSAAGNARGLPMYVTAGCCDPGLRMHTRASHHSTPGSRHRRTAARKADQAIRPGNRGAVINRCSVEGTCPLREGRHSQTLQPSNAVEYSTSRALAVVASPSVGTPGMPPKER